MTEPKTPPPKQVEFACPSCGLQVLAHFAGTEGGDYLTHVMPMCERFERVDSHDDAADYLRAARIKLGGAN